jgi:hypothetical protein
METVTKGLVAVPAFEADKQMGLPTCHRIGAHRIGNRSESEIRPSAKEGTKWHGDVK